MEGIPSFFDPMRRWWRLNRLILTALLFFLLGILLVFWGIHAMPGTISKGETIIIALLVFNSFKIEVK